jgi:hypothetical protein
MDELLKFDRISFSTVSFDCKGQNQTFLLSKSVYKRLCASWHLTCAAYNLPYSE